MESAMRSEQCRQKDLFRTEMPVPDLHPGLQMKLAPLLQALLREGADIKRPTEGPKSKSTENVNDQDHS
jgi:hypothetical protein